ncbi:hypothetical protein ISCGN_009356 [Ixodes scapularis]
MRIPRLVNTAYRTTSIASNRTPRDSEMAMSLELTILQLICLCLSVAVVGASSDATYARWFHGTNSRRLLDEALKGDEPVFLEADVVVEGSMAVLEHPLDQPWDLSLRDLLNLVTAKPKRVTLKLDFKSTEVLPSAINVLMGALTENLKDLWLHADAVPGPGGKPPVDASTFLRYTTPFHPFAVVSLGWTTKNKGAYSWRNVETMARLTRCGQPYLRRVAFSVRASMVENSLPQLAWLVDVVPNSTLSVWYPSSEAPPTEALLKLRQTIPESSVVYDLPRDYPFENLVDAPIMEEDQDWRIDWKLTGDSACQKTSLIGKRAVVLGDQAVSATLPDPWADFEAKLDLSKPRSVAVSLGKSKLTLEGPCFYMVLNRNGQKVTSHVWGIPCKDNTLDPARKESPAEMTREWDFENATVPLVFESSPGGVVYAAYFHSAAPTLSCSLAVVLMAFAVLAV